MDLDSTPRPLAELLAGLPPEPAEAALLGDLQRAVRQAARPLIAVDDDPTGVQTVYDTPVLLTWGQSELQDQLARPDPVFFLLTNSRSMPTPEAERVNEQTGRLLAAARQAAGLGRFAVASRSDSTLRGHYPAELLALAAGLGETLDGHLLVPAFFEGGRYTIDDVHWVATPDASSGDVIPASATPFARDTVFGYHSARLPEWVQEKSGGRWSAAEVESVPLRVVREGPEAVCARLMLVSGGVPVAVNVAGYGDLTVFVLGLLQAEAKGKRFLYRTSASFVRVRAGLAPRPLLTATEIYAACNAEPARPSQRSGLLVVGSHVPSSTVQLERLLAANDLRPLAVEVDVHEVLGGHWSPGAVSARLDAALQDGQLAVLHTSRELVTGRGDENLTIGRRVTEAILAVLRHVRVRPRFVLAKGGITSHEVARQGLGARRAYALGQLVAGVPVWRLESGPELRFPGMPYVVFPGNVGGPESLVEAIRALEGNQAFTAPAVRPATT